MKKVLIYFIFFTTSFILSSCLTDSDSEITARGKIVNIEMSSWMYGTHTLQNDEGRPLYALRSSKINLDDYNGKNVSIKGDKIEGYPVDGGPIYLDVKEVEEIK